VRGVFHFRADLQNFHFLIAATKWERLPSKS
jgi:hypothetical protein